MSGSNQSVNLQGMLGDIASTVGDMGKAYDFIPNAIREVARPEVDMNDPNAMKAYGMWLSRNGNEAAGAQMMQAAATRQKELRVLEGEAKIMALRSGYHAMLPSEKADAEKAMAGIANEYGVSSLKLANTLESIRQAERQLDDADLTTANQNAQFANRINADLDITESNNSTQLAIAGMQNQTTQRGQDIQWRLGKGDQDIRWAGLAEQEKQRLSTEAIANSKIEYDYNALEEGARQFDKNLSFQNMQLEQVAWMDSRTVANWAEQNDLAWKGMSLQERQVSVTELLADNTIDETTFSQIMRSNQDRRANDLLPHEIGLLQAQVNVLKEDARFKNINWQKVEYELGLAEKLEPTVIKRAKLDNRLVNAQISRTEEEADLLAAQTRTERERPDYVEAQVEAMEALTDLQQDEFQWNQRVEQTAMELADLNAISARAVDEAQAFNLTGLSNSRLFSDQLTMAGLLGDKVSQAQKDAYSYGYDPTNPNSIAGARRAFLITHPGEGQVFDEVATARATTQRLFLETDAFSRQLKESAPISDSELRDARMPEDLIRQLSTLPAAERVAQINQWVNREVKGERTGVPTNDLVAIYTAVADDMVSEAFGWDVMWGLDLDSVNEANLKEEVAAAMASAAAAGYSDGQRYAAGMAVMRNAVKKSGSNDAISGLGRLQLKYGE
jgi:hypothetical protein